MVEPIYGKTVVFIFHRERMTGKMQGGFDGADHVLYLDLDSGEIGKFKNSSSCTIKFCTLLKEENIWLSELYWNLEAFSERKKKTYKQKTHKALLSPDLKVSNYT